MVPRTLDEGRYAHWLWTTRYFLSRNVYWAVTAYLMLIVAVPSDSVARDFVLFGGLIFLAILNECRSKSMAQVVCGYHWLAVRRGPVRRERDAEGAIQPASPRDS